MIAKFGITREKQNNLFYKEYKNDKCEFQFHSQIELYFVDEGEMEMCVNCHTKTLKKGQMSVSLSYDAHAYKTPKSSASSTLIIPTYMCEEFIQYTKDKRVTNPFIENTAVVSKIKGYIREMNRKNINDITLSGLIYVILGTVMENITFEKTSEPIDPQLSSKILFYINSNFKSNISLSTISTALGYSSGYLSRYFKSCFNIGINQYITNVRLKNALMLMHEKKYSIAYCAFESGFNSMRTFYRVFSVQFGCSPKEYVESEKCRASANYIHS